MNSQENVIVIYGVFEVYERRVIKILENPMRRVRDVLLFFSIFIYESL